MNAKKHFLGRTISVISDLSLDEQIYLYEKVKQLKNALAEKDKKLLDSFRINDPDFGLYEVFIEDSTRTKESSKNAAEFHRIKLNVMDVDHSSFNKQESYADTFNNLIGYNNHIFVIRSKLEGVCRWLESSGREYSLRHNLGFTPSFINAGDGQHEHPTQELLDEFTFFEDNKWDLSNIHLAMVGDLYHGRTTHSKVNGLKIFKNVIVDLVAPNELAMPSHYIEKMKENGFEVREFESIREYLSQSKVADKWYMTRLQLERMGEDILRRQDELKGKVEFKKEYLDQLPKKIVFYHPLPRVKQDIILPLFLDNTQHNHYESQSRNGMLTRIILFGAIAGVPAIGDDFEGQSVKQIKDLDDFVNEVSPHEVIKKYAEGINPIQDGIVIDHICRGENDREIREHISQIIRVTELYGRGGEWISESKSESGKYKGIIFRPNYPEPDEKWIKKLAAIAPGSTLNIIKNGHVSRKLRLEMPPRIYGLDGSSCTNESCISYPEHKEGVPAEFYRKDNIFICKYCEKPHTFKEVWK